MSTTFVTLVDISTTTAQTTPQTTTTEQAPVHMPGDVDLNGRITINDALEILKYLAKLESIVNEEPQSFLNASIVGDSPTINDALEILKHLAKLDSRLDLTANED
jgi:hypothetical protein